MRIIYRVLGLTLFSIVTLALICCSSQKQKSAIANDTTITFPKDFSDIDKIYGLNKIWSELKYNFVNIDKVDFNIDSLYTATIPIALATKNDFEYYEVLQNFLASFNDGHTKMVPTFNWNRYYDYVPCTIKEFEGRFYFTSIRNNSDIDKSLLFSEIIEVEGKPTLDYIVENIFPHVSASTYEHKLMQATTKLMQGPIGSVFNGKALQTNGKITNFSIVKNGETTRTTDDSIVGSYGRIPRYWTDLYFDEDIAILEINTFSPDELPQHLDSLANIINAKAKGLIIDLRMNGGGSTLNARHLQQYITTGDSLNHFGAQMRTNNSYYKSQGNYIEKYRDYYTYEAYETEPASKKPIANNVERFKMPIAILIGRYSFSACEDFLVNIYEMPNRPILIGESTGGSTGAPLMVFLPHGFMATICSVRITFPISSEPFINSGIRPDIEVIETIEDFKQGLDPAKSKAIAYVKSMH